MQLVIGNKNYSSWSLRPWLLMKHFDVAFDEQQIWLFSEQMQSDMQRFCPSLKVPVLIDHELKIWDSLAICEYINEQYLSGKGWPIEVSQRSIARSICSEMHSGFNAIRTEMPMNCRREPSAITLTDQALLDIQRVIDIFDQCLAKTNKKGAFLFGEFSIADAFYMPIIARFKCYAITVPNPINDYMEAMLNLPAYQLWLTQAQNESAIIEIAEVD
jgi:glutathione S-transferase